MGFVLQSWCFFVFKEPIVEPEIEEEPQRRQVVIQKTKDPKEKVSKNKKKKKRKKSKKHRENEEKQKESTKEKEGETVELSDSKDIQIE